ncbi:beta-1,4 N-acetylgalactosaminyltransferase 2-like [Eucyclogobius newberryi]|uniref:beta-1,4 N-acetylgalactosaminyltransferase 2-like n=1 Tax=Eucyclogobius newberryi TaxID=166745 RepID=UPI003B5CC735
MATRTAPAPSGPCECQPGSVQLKDHIPKEEFDKVFQRRKEELEKHKKRTPGELSTLLVAPPNSPLQYPIQGFTVLPLRSTLVPGLAVSAGERSSYKVILKVSKGILSTDVSRFREVTVKGNKEAELTVECSSLLHLNDLLASISYQSTIYHVHTGDLASFSFENHEAIFPIIIRQPQLPVVFEMGTDINSQVTVTIKTFLRYNNLKVLLSSIRRFYPNITVIIADDSKKPEKITGENIQQYIMPPAQGWFAGRNLAVSQVTTKYFLWSDDDFVFTENTKIEKMIEVMEAVPELDVVGGSVQGNQFYFSLEYDEGDEAEGGCLYRKSSGRFHALRGYPQCFLASGVVNFFLARTDSIQKSRFDPLLKRVAHSEWFMDGLGSLMVASCSDVSIGHQPKTNSNEYKKFRYDMDTAFKFQLHYFKNNLKCIKFG